MQLLKRKKRQLRAGRRGAWAGTFDNGIGRLKK